MQQRVEALNASADTRKDGETFVLEKGEDVSHHVSLFQNATVLCDAAHDGLGAWVLFRNAPKRYGSRPVCDRCVVSPSCKERAMGQKCEGEAK